MVPPESSSRELRELVDTECEDLDRARMARIREGDPAALDSLMAEYWARLVAYAGKLLGNPDGAEDVVQETFVRIWYRRADFQLSGSVRCYLYRVARNLIRDEARKGKVRATWAKTESTRRVFADDPHQVLEQEELTRIIEQKIQALPPRRREVFVLAHLHELTYRESARS